MVVKLYKNPTKSLRPCKFTYSICLFGIYICMALLVLSSISCSNDKNEIIVLSAASMADVMNEIVVEFEKNQDANVHISFAGSQYLAQQLIIGSPGDIILSAGESPIEFLLEREIVEPNTVNLLSNHLVVIARPNSLKRNISSPIDLVSNEIKYLAIADPRLAPAGVYTKESLTNLDLWNSMNGRILRTPDVRAAMLAVTTGAAQAGIVYYTDAITLSDIEIFDIIPRESYKKIKYVIATNKLSSNKLLVADFISFLNSKSAENIYSQHGFELYK